MATPLYQRVIPETYVQLLFEYLDMLDHDPVQVLGMPAPIPNEHGIGCFSVERWEELLNISKAFLNDPFLGLHVGQNITSQHLGILGSVILACDNLGTALERFDRYQRLVFDVLPATIQKKEDYVEVSWNIQEHQTRGLGLVDETGFTVIVQFCRNLTRKREGLQEVHFSHEYPSDLRPYQEFFGCNVLFEQPVPLLRFDPDILNLPLKSPNSILVEILDKHADQLLDQLPQIEELIELMHKYIAQSLHQGEPDIKIIADRMHYSPRTLQRRLKELNTSFRKELNFVRYQLAKSYLKDVRLQIVEIALLLGYAEHSAFTRAYKEWSGKTPQQERKVHESQEGSKVIRI